MKKSIAAVSAVVLGVGGAATGAFSASAADPISPCASALDHNVEPTSAVDAHWYMACEPQFGLGKAEFTITSTEQFPAGFTLADSTETGSANLAGSGPYFSGTVGSNTTTGLFAFSPHAYIDAHTQSYGVFAAFPITSVEQFTGTLPATCTANNATYDHLYRVNYASAKTTLTQTVNGKSWKFTIPVHPQALILGLNFLDQGTGLDPARPLCAVVEGSTAYFGAQQGDGDWDTIAGRFATQNFVETLVPLTDVNEDLGTFARVVPASTTPTASADPQLAETGVSPVPAGIAAASLLAIAVGFFAIGRRRRSAARKH
ncbi:MAG: hypothetical protein QOI02_1565 [Actinomycetota bacterium]|nr:hypothetical protein [Actinomycetota bacterium]